MVGVLVGEHQVVDTPHRQAPERRRKQAGPHPGTRIGRVAAAIHHHPFPVRQPQQRRIPLPHAQKVSPQHAVPLPCGGKRTKRQHHDQRDQGEEAAHPAPEKGDGAKRQAGEKDIEPLWGVG